MRYALTNAGKERASEALRRCEYIGPVPVRWRLTRPRFKSRRSLTEVISIDKLKKAMSHLVLSETSYAGSVPRQTTASNSDLWSGGQWQNFHCRGVGRAFEQPVYIPYAIEADGQIIKIYDPSVHVWFPAGDQANGHSNRFFCLI
jgi:hypothetical protein